MSKPSASGRPRKNRLDRRYHRANLGGGNVLKAVTRATRSHRIFGPYGSWLKGPEQPNYRAARRKAMEALLEVAEELEAEAA